MGMIRLDKYISSQTLFSRSEIRKMIFKGQVKVDGVCILKPDFKIDENTVKVSLDDREINFEKYVYLVMNKPKGILSATTDKNSKTAVDLLPEEYKKRNIFPAGRLDKDSTGMLILTDDGDFAHRITGPKHHIEKAYIVTLDTLVTDEMIDGFRKGVTLVSGEECSPAVCEKISDKVARVILTEGKYHQIKRMFGIFDAGVEELHRERIGKMLLPSDLKEGEYCKILPENLLD
ncbi:MAG: rRNA pseudouridine synthase [Ruminococcaceae bacterium]|nr:rRNA pseudouridine synthase [Oscillospiraceae bacterium]